VPNYRINPPNRRVFLFLCLIIVFFIIQKTLKPLCLKPIFKKLKSPFSILRVVCNNYFYLVYFAPKKQDYNLKNYLSKTISYITFATKASSSFLWSKKQSP